MPATSSTPVRPVMARRHWQSRGDEVANQHQIGIRRTLLEIVAAGPDFSSALCAQIDPHYWFPEKGAHGADEKKAAAMCSVCPVRRACLEHALEHPELTNYGVWAGYTAAPLKRMRKYWRVLHGKTPVYSMGENDCAPPKQGVTSGHNRAEGAHHAA